MLGLVLQAAPGGTSWSGDAGLNPARGLLALAVVFGLLGLLAWLARRGSLGRRGLAKRGGALGVETALPLGERRSLVIVSVEGRRLLLGLSPMQVTLLTELRGSAPPSFDEALSRAGAPPEGRTS
jgi:flagellar biosynthetic protein FliO